MSQPAKSRQVSIVAAGRDLASDMARLHGALFDAAWDAAGFERLLDHPGAMAIVARAGDPPGVVGFILGCVAADEAEILTLGMSVDLQRCGIGQRLVTALNEAAKRAGASRVHLEVAAGNAAARAFYRQLGFRESGRRKRYYARAGCAAEDAINLSLAL